MLASNDKVSTAMSKTRKNIKARKRKRKEKEGERWNLPEHRPSSPKPPSCDKHPYGADTAGL
jgi:hypothetical protein